MKHKIEYDKNLIEELSNLRYDVLSEFLNALAKKIYKDSRKDYDKGKNNLSESLKYASAHLENSADYIEEAWNNCKRFM